MASTPTATKPKPSPPDAIVELRPPADFGFGGTVKLLAASQSVLIAELLKRGYTKVEAER